MKEFSLDKIFFIPTKSPVHKTHHVADSSDRAAMIELAIAGVPGLELSRIEIDRETPSYSVVTVREISSLYPGAELFFILGTDAFNDLRTWKESEALMQMISFIVMGRGNRRTGDQAAFCRSVHFSGNEIVDVSSTAVRQMILSGESLEGSVPDSVARYIREKRLYST
jgi:nicotinate-nucleotide adenylyltransferase